MVPFESLGAVSYSHSMVTIALSCMSSEIKPDIGRKSWFFHTPLAFDAPVRGGPRRSIVIPFDIEKLEWWGYPTMKNFDDMYNRLHINRHVTDGQTDILPRHSPRYAYAWRGKNSSNEVHHHSKPLVIVNMTY